MRIETLKRLIEINVAGGNGANSRQQIRAATIGDAPTDELRSHFNAAFDELKASGVIRADGAGWYLTAHAEQVRLTTDPAPADFQAVPAPETTR